jgi:serine/threonine protein phosphatase PrpC
VKDHLIGVLTKLDSYKNKNYEQALTDIYVKIDKMLMTDSKTKEKLKTYKNSAGQGSMYVSQNEDIAMGTGCTAVSAFVTPDKIFVGNSGDSRAVVGLREGSNIKGLQMSEDHKPDNIEEKARIEKAGGFVEEGRVKGVLNLSRSLGDLEYKTNKKLKPEQQMITCVPEVRMHRITPETKFLFIACDGIWDCVTSQEGAQRMDEKLAMRKPTEKISKLIGDLFDEIIA